jgi:hypothetical protein
MKNISALIVFLLSSFFSYQTNTNAQNFEWAKNCGNGDAFGVTTDNAGNYYVTGRFYGQSSFGTFTITSYGNNDIFGNSLIVNNNNIYLAGKFTGTANFGSISLTNRGGFIAKLSDATLDIGSSIENIPQEFILEQNYPNPFNPSTKIS